MSEPMSESRLGEIKADYVRVLYSSDPRLSQAIMIIRELVQEVERLREISYETAKCLDMAALILQFGGGAPSVASECRDKASQLRGLMPEAQEQEPNS